MIRVSQQREKQISNLQKLIHSVSCSLCAKTFMELNSKILQISACEHNFCQNCINLIYQQEKMSKCPKCQLQLFSSKNICQNIFLTKLFQINSISRSNIQKVKFQKIQKEDMNIIAMPTNRQKMELNLIIQKLRQKLRQRLQNSIESHFIDKQKIEDLQQKLAQQKYYNSKLLQEVKRLKGQLLSIKSKQKFSNLQIQDYDEQFFQKPSSEDQIIKTIKILKNKIKIESNFVVFQNLIYQEDKKNKSIKFKFDEYQENQNNFSTIQFIERINKDAAIRYYYNALNQQPTQKQIIQDQNFRSEMLISRQPPECQSNNQLFRNKNQYISFLIHTLEKELRQEGFNIILSEKSTKKSSLSIAALTSAKNFILDKTQKEITIEESQFINFSLLQNKSSEEFLIQYQKIENYIKQKIIIKTNIQELLKLQKQISKIQQSLKTVKQNFASELEEKAFDHKQKQLTTYMDQIKQIIQQLKKRQSLLMSKEQNVKKNKKSQYLDRIDKNDIIIISIQSGSFKVKYLISEMSNKFKFVRNLYISKEDFHESGNIIFAKWNNHEQKRLTRKRGGWPYYQPVNCMRFGLNVSMKFDEGDDSWLKMDNNPKQWSVAFHGVRNPFDVQNSRNTLTVVQLIIKSYKQNNQAFIIGTEQQNEFRYALNKDQKIGKGVYCTPYLRYALNYCKKSIQLNNQNEYYVIFMIRVNPKSIKICPNQTQYWLINNSKDLRPYGIILINKKEAQKYENPYVMYNQVFHYEYPIHYLQKEEYFAKYFQPFVKNILPEHEKNKSSKYQDA